MVEIFTHIKESFCGLMSYKLHGEDVIEIITPFTTITSKFISIFIKTEGGHYIISDNGWIQNEAYDVRLNESNSKTQRVIEYFLST